MTLPIRPVKRPLCLLGQQNGRIPDTLLERIPGLAGGPTVRLVEPAARAWRAMTAAAADAGVILKATSMSDSFRPYFVQERIFRERYTTTPLSARPSRRWDGRRWYQKPGTAAAAVPGTSNHGWALAVDTGGERDGDAGTEPIDEHTLGWLLEHAEDFGWSWELQSEPWHLRYFAGDDIPNAVLAHEENDMFNDQDREALHAMRAELTVVKAEVATLRKAVAGKADDTNGMSWLGERVAEIKASLKDIASKVG